MADKLSELAAMSDEELLKALNLDKKVDKARQDLTELDKLTGDARDHALERIQRMFEPNIYPDEFHWIKEDAEREAKRKAKAQSCGCGSDVGEDMLDSAMVQDEPD